MRGAFGDEILADEVDGRRMKVSVVAVGSTTIQGKEAPGRDYDSLSDTSPRRRKLNSMFKI